MGLHIEKAGAGETCIFVHGAGGNTHTWYYQKKYLQTHMEVVLIDLPGHGDSPGDGCNTIDEFKDALYETVQILKIEKSYIAGHSMGGAIVMSLALSYPHIFKGIILIGTGAKLGVLPEILDGVVKEKEKTVHTITELVFSKKTSPILKENGFKEMMKCKKEILYKDFYSCNYFNVMDSIKSINLPVLIICGMDDLLTPPKYSEYLNKNIKDSKLTLIKDAGHMVMLEKPEELNKAIEAWITVTGSGSPVKTRKSQPR